MPLRILPLLAFLGLLLLPTAVHLAGWPRVAPLQEYRRLADWPASSAYLAPGKPGFLAYTAQLNRWHLDHFPTRAFWVRVRTQAIYSLFGESDQVHVGRNGWLYYRSVVDVETPQVERISPEARRALVAKLARVSDLLAERGVRLYVMPMALKHRYYPEYLPAAARHARTFRFYDAFMDELAAEGRVRLVDSRVALEAAKRDGLKIFHQTDFHWTDPAAPPVMRNMLDDMATASGIAPPPWDYDLAVEEAFVGGQARALPLLRTPSERTVMLRLKRPLTRFDYATGRGGIEWSGVAQPGQGPLLPPILAYGDSFLDAGSRAGFFNFFEAFARARLGQVSLASAWSQRPPGTRFLLVEWITSATFSIDQELDGLIKRLEQDSP